jgi:hypothetical protein
LKVGVRREYSSGDDLADQTDGGRQQNSDHGRQEAVPRLLEQNLLEVEEEDMGHVGQKEFWVGCRNCFQILKQGFWIQNSKIQILSN